MLARLLLSAGKHGMPPQEGKCTFGNKCKWSHEVQEGARGEFHNASAKEKGEGKKEKFMSLITSKTTKQMVADLLTKAVSKLTFETLVGSLFGKEM